MAFLKDSGSKKIVDAIRYTAKQNVWNDPEEEVLPEDICTIIGPPGPQGERGPQGEGFSIYKSYISIEEMNNDANNVEVGKFVIIAAAGPHPEEDPDNSKLFVRNSEGGFTFVNDLSGSQGIQGPTEWEKITNRPTSLPASDVYDWAKASTKPSYSYSEVGAAASSHRHHLNDIYDGESNELVDTLNQTGMGDGNFYFVTSNTLRNAFPDGTDAYVEIYEQQQSRVIASAIITRKSEHYQEWVLKTEIITTDLINVEYGGDGYYTVAILSGASFGSSCLVKVYTCNEALLSTILDNKSDKGHTHNILSNLYSSRPTSANLTATGSGGLSTFKASSSMTTGKGNGDGHILNFYWDNTDGWDSQLFVPNSNSRDMQYRAMQSGTWQSWKTILDNSNYDNYVKSSPIFKTKSYTITVGVLSAGDAKWDQTYYIDILKGYTPAVISGFYLTGTNYTKCTITKIALSGSNSLLWSVQNLDSASTGELTLTVNVLYIRTTNISS